MQKFSKSEIQEIAKETSKIIMENLEPEFEVIRKTLAEIKEILSKH